LASENYNLYIIVVLIIRCCLHDMLSCFHRTPACDRRTERQTHRAMACTALTYRCLDIYTANRTLYWTTSTQFISPVFHQLTRVQLACVFVLYRPVTENDKYQLSLTKPRDALQHGKRQHLNTVTW